LELVLTLFITTVAAIGIGLVISAVSRSTEMAIYIMTLLVFFHLFFAGTMYDLRENPAEPLSYVTATRWSLLAMGETLQLDELAESTIVCEQAASCFNYPQARETLTLPYGEENAILQSWAILIGLGTIFYSLLGIILHRTKAT